MKTSELIKQLKELKESFKASERQIDADKKVYDKMQYIAGILKEDEGDDLIGREIFVSSQGLTMSGRGTVDKNYVVIGKKGDLYKVVPIERKDDPRRDDYATTYVGTNLMTADYIKNHTLEKA